MASKEILAVATAPDQESVFAVSEHLAQSWGAHLTALYLARQLQPMVGDPALAASLWAEVAQQNQALAASEFAAIKERIKRIGAQTEIRREDVFAATAEGVAARHAMHADLTILQSPSTAYGDAAFEGALFRSGRPVLLTAPNWKAQTIGKRIMVAWKAKREAARALADAETFLREADQITVVTVDAQLDGYGAGPGRDICTHLARKGLSVELRNIDGMGRPAEMGLLNEARALEADLIVMGGYGHSRLREFVFGGVTRAISRNAPIPVLMSH
jgi:nucleotide-binding universal stress UspA family protein